MKILIFILFYLLNLGYTQAQKIKLRNTEFIEALRLGCPKCIDKHNQLTAHCKKIKRLVFKVEEVSPFLFGDELTEEVLIAEYVSDGVDFSLFRNLEQLTIVGFVGSKIINWPKKLKSLDLSNFNYSQTIPNLPDKLVYLNLGMDLRDYSEGQNRSFFDYIQLPASIEVLIMKYDINLSNLKSLPPKLKVLISRYNKTADELLNILPNTLKVLRLEGCQIKQLPAQLPDSLQYLHLEANYLYKLPNLPPNLKVLDLDDNSIDTFPDSFPKGLKELYLFRNHLKQLPKNLPPSLEKLHLSRQMIKEADFSTLIRLKELNISVNELSRLVLPPSLQILNCSNNQLTVFNNTLPNLKELYINNNQVGELVLKSPKLNFLDCSHNLIKNLQVGDCKQLNVLNCANNALNQLDKLPQSLTQLNCGGNQLSELPPIPPKLFYLDYSGNKINTAPKFPPHLTQIVDKTVEEIEEDNKKDDYEHYFDEEEPKKGKH